MPKNICTNTYGVSKFVVSPDATQGNFATIQAAINAAASGQTIYVRDGTYTEDLVLKAGVFLVSESQNLNLPVIIQGSVTFSGTVLGTTGLSGFQLINSTGPNVIFSGTGQQALAFVNCQLRQQGAFPIFSGSNTNAIQSFIAKTCTLVLENVGASLFNVSSGGMQLSYCKAAGATATAQSVCSVAL